jgi:pimeloyl-ACP methyl ester carboxylesterase
MEYELIGLQEHGMFVSQPQGLSGRKDITINWSFDLNISFPKDGQVAIKIDAKINVTQPEEHPAIGHFSASHYFSAANVPEALSGAHGEKMLNFIATLVGISLGSMRGLAYARTYNVYGGSVFMPVVNPTELLKGNLPRILKELETKPKD